MLPRSGEVFARRYRIVRELGRGAMGVVFEAKHETLEQKVAIKVLRDADDDRAQRRFEREAKIAARLDSPHVVKVLDVDRTESGVPYLVMELLEGHDLSAEVEERSEVELATAIEWILAVCDAMVLAHEAGVVHRDLKLSNVFLTKNGVIKVLDFGVASLKDTDAERSTTATVAGTPRYMAPEQLLGEAPNPASDVWAIGVMLYRILSGKFPYDAPTMAAQMLAIMEGCPPLDEVAPRVPKELSAIVMRALGRTLEERIASAKELGDALAPFASARSEAPPPKQEEPAAPAKRSHRGPLLAGAAALVLIALVALKMSSSSEPPSSPAMTTSAAKKLRVMTILFKRRAE